MRNSLSSSWAGSLGKYNSSRMSIPLFIGFLSMIFISCTDIWGPWDNPWDPDFTISSSPLDGADVFTNRPLLNWNDITGASGYELQISDTSSGVSSATSILVNSSQYQVPSNLHTGDWYWRIRCSKNGNLFPWCRVSCFWIFSYKQTFEDGRLPSDWTGDWEISATPNSGAYSLKSKLIPNNGSTSTQVSISALADGLVYFYRKVSSELNYDFLHFFIDGSEKGSWSGDVPWGRISFPISKGTHVLKWTYSKDGSAVVGSDCCWIDDIVIL